MRAVGAYDVYGIDLDAHLYKKNVYKLALDLIKKKDSACLIDIERLHAEPENTELEEDEVFCLYCEEYENSVYLWRELEGLLTDVINEIEFNNETVFRCQYNCVYVEPDIPKNEEAKALYPTQEQIAKILQEYFGTLLDYPIDVKWLTMYDD